MNIHTVVALAFLGLGSLLTSAQSAEEAAELYQNKKWKEAAAAYRQVVEQSPDNMRAWFRLGSCYVQLGQGEQALEALNKAAENPKLPPVFLHYARAQAHHLSGQTNDTWEALDQAVAAGYANLGNIESDEVFADLKDSERFQNVLKAVDKNARPCAYDDRYREFDFWLGKWEVYGNLEKTGPLYGHNTIRKEENGCMLTESWVSASGSTGRSVNFYDGTIDKWVQHWVSANGGVITYSGGLEDGSMRLTGRIYYPKPPSGPQVRDFRGTWSPLDGGVVRQFFEESIDGGETWYTWFDGYYFPMED